MGGQTGEQQSEPGKHGEPPTVHDVGAAVRQHVPPGGRRILHTQTEEAQAGLEDDDTPYVQCCQNDDSVGDIGQYVTPKDPERTATSNPGQSNEVPFPEGHDLPAGNTSEASPVPDDEDY